MFSFFMLQCKQMYFQLRKLTNIFYFGRRFIHLLAQMIATRTQLCNYLFFRFQSGWNDCSQDCLRPICAINFLRDQSSDKLINFLDSQLDTRDSRLDPRASRLNTRNFRGSSIESRGSIEARGTVNLLLSGTVCKTC